MTLGPGEIHIPSAHALLEAGEAESAALLSAIARRVDELLAGQVLEVVAHALGAYIDVAAWCRAADHELVALLAEHTMTRFWIRKGGPTANEEATRSSDSEGLALDVSRDRR